MKGKSLSALTVLCAAASLQAANLIPGDSSFETGYGIWNKIGKIVKTNTVNGSCAVRIETVMRSVMLFDLKPKVPHVLSVWLKAEKPNSPVMIQAYRRNWDGRNITKHVKAGTEWTRYELPIRPQAFGDYNKFQLVIAPQKKGMAVFADAVQLETAEKATAYESAEPLPFACEVQSPVPGNLFLEGENPEFAFRVFNARKEKTEAAAELSVTDYYGKTVLKRKEILTLEPGQTLERKFKLSAPEKKGFYQMEYALTGPDGQRRVRKGSFCVLAHPLKRPSGTRPLFGLCSVNAHTAATAVCMGVQSAALAYRWSYIKKNGELGNTGSMDRAVNTLHDNGIEVNLYMRRTPSFAAMKKSPTDRYPPKEEYAASYEDFAFRLASRYKGKVKSYQIWGGEADGTEKLAIRLGKNRAWFLNLLAELTKYGYKGIKRADPNALVDTSAVCGADCEGSRFPFQSALLAKIRGYYDRVVIHPYCYPWTFDDTKYVQSPEQADLVRKYHTISKIAGGKRVVNGEYGFAISPKEDYGSPAARRRAAYMARSILLTALCPEVDHIMYYTVAEGDGHTIIDWPNPYPDAAAYSALARQLCGAVSPRELILGSLAKACSFTVPDGGFAAVWIPSDKEIMFEPAATDTVRAFDIMGNEISVKQPILLSGAPVYFRSTEGQESLDRFLRKGKLMIQPLALEIRASDDKTLTVLAVNQLTGELSGTITLRVPVVGGKIKTFTQKFSRLRTNGIMENLPVEIPDGIDFHTLNSGTEITAEVKTAEGNMKYSQKIEVLPCPKLNFTPKIDGDLSKWEKLPGIELKTMDYLFPPDAFSHGTWTSPADLSIKAWVAWDDRYFYFAARVTDDVFVNSFDASELWRGDSIQMAFDPTNDARGPGYRSDEVEINLAYSSKTETTLVSQSWPLPIRFPKSVRAVVKPGAGYIVYEAAIPFSMLDPLAARPGKVFGFNFAALDNDLKKVDYWMGLTYGICGGKNASLFKKFILTEGEKQK